MTNQFWRAMIADHARQIQPGRRSTLRYILELSDIERKNLARAISKMKRNGQNTDDIDHLRDDLQTMTPNAGVVIEAPADADLSQFTVTTSLQMPLDIIFTQTSGNHVSKHVPEQTRDPERVLGLIASIRVNRSLQPLLAVIDTLRDMIESACESVTPNLQSIGEHLNDFADHIEKARQALREH